MHTQLMRSSQLGRRVSSDYMELDAENQRQHTYESREALLNETNCTLLFDTREQRPPTEETKDG